MPLGITPIRSRVGAMSTTPVRARRPGSWVGSGSQERLLASPIEAATPAGLTQMAWDLADRMGWAKTYDAHYVALADHLGCKLLTLDERLIRGIARLGLAVRPRDL
jgi:predicted nucleic acid-binding protein